jgi:uncharacterized protein (DUF1778 family)
MPDFIGPAAAEGERRAGRHRRGQRREGASERAWVTYIALPSIHDGAQCAYNRDEVIMAIATNPESKSKRFNLRATPNQENLIRVAAKRRGIEVADFIIQSACEKAEQTLADQTRFVLDQTQWDLFMNALDAPPRVIPQIQKLFAEPPIAKSR